MAAERERPWLANEQTLLETAQQPAAERLAGDWLARESLAAQRHAGQQQVIVNQLLDLLIEQRDIAERSGQAARDLLGRLESLQQRQLEVDKGIDLLYGCRPRNGDELNFDRVQRIALQVCELEELRGQLELIGVDLELQQNLQNSSEMLQMLLDHLLALLTPEDRRTNQLRQHSLDKRRQQAAADEQTRRVASRFRVLSEQVRVSLQELQELRALSQTESLKDIDKFLEQSQKRADQINLRAQREPQVDSDSDAETDAEADAEVDADADSDAETDAEADADTDAEVEADVDSSADDGFQAFFCHKCSCCFD